ncbi:hypothetical protein AAY47_01965 [Xenorhabdus griffiniae]|nr:hypothetical protein AAY47_01965 [Xenorhabdus griffiniae]
MRLTLFQKNKSVDEKHLNFITLSQSVKVVVFMILIIFALQRLSAILIFTEENKHGTEKQYQ